MEVAEVGKGPKLVNRFKNLFTPVTTNRKPRAGDALLIGEHKYLVVSELHRGRLIIKPAQDNGRRGSR